MVAIGLLVDEAFVAEPANLAVGVDDAVLTVFHCAFDQHFSQAAFGIVEVIGVDAVAPFVEVSE
ncbi:hypothetical protein D3C75_1364400 [compost metagenome]